LWLIHARTAARSAAWSGMPSAPARLSRCFQTLAGKRTERGMVAPVSVPFWACPDQRGWRSPPPRYGARMGCDGPWPCRSSPRASRAATRGTAREASYQSPSS
jgi:hypothetical protein